MKTKRFNQRFWTAALPNALPRAWVVGGDPRDGHYVTTRLAPVVVVKAPPAWKRADLH
jgi:hypothetical protein